MWKNHPLIYLVFALFIKYIKSFLYIILNFGKNNFKYKILRKSQANFI
jgi:hypothetical protein